MISILVNSRAEGNVNQSLLKLLYSLKVSTNQPENIELLVKYDADDMDFPALRESIKQSDYKFKIKFAIGLRDRGYIDIHKGYNQLLEMIDNRCRIIVAMADDFTCNGGWDDRAREAVKDAGDLFILHQRPHPYLEGEPTGILNAFRDKHDVDKFAMEMDMFDASNLHIIDEAPMWSRRLIDTVGFFPVSFTDAWTLALEYCLWQNHKINITKFMTEIYINRTTCAVDQPGNERWYTDRKWNFDYIKSNDFRELVADQASYIAEVYNG